MSVLSPLLLAKPRLKFEMEKEGGRKNENVKYPSLFFNLILRIDLEIKGSGVWKIGKLENVKNMKIK